jgi:hypothetical protein
MRELYLLIEGEGFAGAITCNPEHGDRVRKFAAAINSAARNVEDIKRDRAMGIERATSALESAKLNTGDVEIAQSTVSELSQGTERLRLVRVAVADSPDQEQAPTE